MPGREKKDPAKPRGRMSSYAFFIQACRGEQKRDHPTETLGFSDFSKQCAERWKAMSTEQKAPFVVQSDLDKQRYDHQMKNYVPPKVEQGRGGKGKKGKKVKVAKDPNAPKKPLTAFFWFSSEERDRVAGKNPNLKYPEVIKELGKMWNAMDENEKKKYQVVAANDKIRYEKEMKEYEERVKLQWMAAQAPVQGTVYAYSGEEEEEDEDGDVEEEEEEVY